MKKSPKLLQCDKRGQIVIPKEVRTLLNIEEGTGFWLYAIQNGGLFLKKVDKPSLDNHPELEELGTKADKLGFDKKDIESAVDQYKKRTEGGMELI